MKKKGGSLVIVDNAPNLVENIQSVKKPTVNSKPLLLANEVFDKEHGGYESDKPEEERRDQVDDYSSHLKNLLDAVAVSKKRKASEKLHSSKYEQSSPYVDSTSKKCGKVVWFQYGCSYSFKWANP